MWISRLNSDWNGTEYSRGEPCTQVFSENRVIHIHITGVARVYRQQSGRIGREGPLPKSLDSDENLAYATL